MPNLAEALAQALKDQAFEYECAIVLIDRGENHLNAAMTGDPQIIVRLLIGALSQMIAQPVTVEPYREH